MNVKEKIRYLLEKGFLVSPDVLEAEVSQEKNLFSDKILQINPLPLVITTEFLETNFLRENIENTRYVLPEDLENIDLKKRSFDDFITLYESRYLKLSQIIKQREKMNDLISISKIRTGEESTFIGMVLDIKTTKNGNFLITFEDKTGTINCIVTESNREAHLLAKEITYDEVVGVIGTKSSGIFFINDIIFPGVPSTNMLKKSSVDESAIFIGDVHVGSKSFYADEFDKFISWINGSFQIPDNNVDVSKIKYLFIVGDLVEGVGVYPGQEKDLQEQDIHKQYRSFLEYIKKIPKRIKIFICPGNHDYIRIPEPQPKLTHANKNIHVLSELEALDNVIFLHNPCYVNIGKTDSFQGQDILLYHGYSIPYYANNIDYIRQAGGLNETCKIMKYLIRKRHLAPTHGSTQYQLGYDEDKLVIDKVPDIFVTGHVHKTDFVNFHGITLLQASCWIGQTDFQEQRGLEPDPCKVLHVNLKTRNVETVSFI